VRADIVFAEHSKQDDPNLWLRRMALSYRRYDDARYLQTMRSIADRLDVQTLQADAVRIFQTDNIATMIRLPRDAVVQ
jgi:zinc protease